MLKQNSTKRPVGFVTLLFLVWTFSNIDPGNSTQASQREERELHQKSWADEPVLIKLVLTKRREVRIGEKFADGDDWFQGLKLRMHNRSGKTITYLDVNLSFQRPPGETGPPLTCSLNYNIISPRSLGMESQVTVSIKRPPIQAGDDADLGLSDKQYESLKL